MGKENKKKSTANHKKEDGKFLSRHVKHDPQAERARAVFGGQNAVSGSLNDPRREFPRKSEGPPQSGGPSSGFSEIMR